MKIIKYLFLFLSFSFISSSTDGQFYYVSEIGNLTALSKQQDFKVAGSLGSALERGSHHNYQIGYSPLPNIGIQASYFKAIFNDVFEQEESFLRSKNAAIGYYKFHKFKKDSKHTSGYPRFKLQKGILLDVYMGYADGKVVNYYNLVESSDLNFRKFYLQGGASLQDGMIGLQTTIRAGVIDFVDGDYIGSNFSVPDQSLLFLELKNTYSFLESSIIMNMGIRHGKFYVAQSFVKIIGENKLPKIKNAFQFGIIISLNEFFIHKNIDQS